ncbi:ABC transporter permease [Spirosoma pollinicola]|uniref:Macrolide ABC transporter permease n=1 Tax=Spirosoma pollinicola TaxID=2057025 RepID=A0A2K8Z0L2_9BACT|nr:ABC transporter permease [Spirosoma pollinicola]AUD03389.1 macrolide ABC transporter permease [Spirosoma pollinicola]
MLTNYLKIAIRNLLRSKSFSAINIVGLSVGMACCMSLLLYIRSELAYDKHQQHTNELYLMAQKTIIGKANKNPDSEMGSAASAPYAFALKSEFPEIEEAGRLWTNIIDDKALLQVRESGKTVKSFYETKGYQVDSTFFDLFSYQFTEGNVRTALSDQHSVVLSEEIARKLFGSVPALNKLIRIGGTSGNGEDFKVTGVYRDESARSHIDARFFLPISAGWVGSYLRDAKMDFCCNNMFVTYLKLRPGTDPAQLEAKFPAFMKKYASNDLKNVGFDKQLFLVPVSDLHLADQLGTVVTPTNSKTYLYILASIALFTLLIACINFMNLSTARSAKRAAEVGVRKVMGAERGSLIAQFLGESMVLSLLALLIALGLVMVFLPVFNQLTAKSLQFGELVEPRIILAFTALALLTGLLAGSYPAFYLSLFNPVQVLKGGVTNSRGANGKASNTLSAVTLRRSLAVFQFVISVGLVLSTLVIQEQMRFLRNTSLGFTQDQQIAIPLSSREAHAAYTAYHHEILQNNQVLGAAGTQFYPGIPNATDFLLYRPERGAMTGKSVETNWVDYDYLQTMGFKLLTGRLFSRQFPGDTTNRIIVNEATLREFQLPLTKAVGQKLNFDWQGETRHYEIVGVLKDFHFENLHQKIEPYCFLLSSQPNYNYIIVHTKTANMASILPFLEQKWKTLRPDEPFTYTFLNEDFQKNYVTEARTSRIVSYFTIISILISCLGLFGLAAFSAQQRTKEIGVRKVLGASVTNIILLLSKDFLTLVIVAILIASPIGWWAMNKWLQNFAYKIAIPWWIFGVAGGLALAIAFITVSFQSIKAAQMNPVKSLRSE